MDFKVFTDRDGGHDTYSDDAWYALEGCVLVVNDGERRVTYGSAGWLYIDELVSIDDPPRY